MAGDREAQMLSRSFVPDGCFDGRRRQLRPWGAGRILVPMIESLHFQKQSSPIARWVAVPELWLLSEPVTDPQITDPTNPDTAPL